MTNRASHRRGFLKPGDTIVISATVIDTGSLNGKATASVAFPGDSGICEIHQHDILQFASKPGSPHPRLKHHWKPPKRPDFLDDTYGPAVYHLTDGSGFEFDFFSPKYKKWGLDVLMEMDHADENDDYPALEWPFIDGFIPTRQDWEALGFVFPGR